MLVVAHMNIIKHLKTCYTYIFIFLVHATKIRRELSKLSNFNTSQTSVLEAAFANNCYLKKTALKQLAHQTGLAERKRRQWFVYRRRREKRGRLGGTLSTSKYM